MLAVPPAVLAKAEALGLDGFLDGLEASLSCAQVSWGLTIGGAFGDATEAFVAEATLRDGTPAVLKVPLPLGAAVRHEIAVLRLAGGEGVATLLACDEERGLLLLERLGRPMSALGLPVDTRHELLCAAAARLWRRAPGARLPSGAAHARRLAEAVATGWEELGRPCSSRAVEHALACAERRIAAHDDGRAVLVHGDVHQWNALEAPGGFKLVDPDGVLAEPELDLGVIMREDPLELIDSDPFARAQRLAAMTGLGAEAIWQWGVLERVSNGLLLSRIGLQPVGSEMLRAAEVAAEADGLR